MNHQLHRFRVLRHRDADDGITAYWERLRRREPGLDQALFQQGYEVIGLADAGAANGPDPCEVLWESGFRAEGRLQSQTLAKFQPRRLMHAPLQLQELAVPFDLPEAIAFEHVNTKGLRAFPLISADGGLVLERQSPNRIALLKPDQTVETAKLIDRNHAVGQDLQILLGNTGPGNPQFWGG